LSPEVQKALRSWRSLVAHLPFLTDDQVEEALREERNGKARKSVLERLAMRATRLTEIAASGHYKKYLDK
jgi:hypothetical protein